VRVGQCRGIDRSPLAAELARATLRIAEARFGRDGEVDVSVGDALFMPWGEVDAIVGNPPFVAKNKLVPELGREYVQRLRAAYPEVSGRADYCVYFFRKSHDSLKVGGRAGLIGTNTIRQNDSRAGGLDTLSRMGGSIVDAVATRVWPGDAVVHVSVVNWVKGAEGLLARQVGDDVLGRSNGWRSRISGRR
jgi:type II restriction/modification system DNA methylase subunit YeeA